MSFPVSNFFYKLTVDPPNLPVDPELKARIDAFLMERRNKNTAFDQAPEDIVHMDTVAE